MIRTASHNGLIFDFTYFLVTMGSTSIFLILLWSRAHATIIKILFNHLYNYFIFYKFMAFEWFYWIVDTVNFYLVFISNYWLLIDLLTLILIYLYRIFSFKRFIYCSFSSWIKGFKVKLFAGLRMWCRWSQYIMMAIAKHFYNFPSF